MFLLVVTILIGLLCLKFNVIAYIRYKFMVERLPVIIEYQFPIGHIYKVLINSREEFFSLCRRYVQLSKPVSVTKITPMIEWLNVTDPEVIEKIINQHTEKGRLYNLLHCWFNEGLLTSKGEKWHSRRKILTPAFHFSILSEFVQVFNRASKTFTESLKQMDLTQPINISEMISDYTLSTLSETSMGSQLDFSHSNGRNYKSAIIELSKILHLKLFRPWLWISWIYNLTKMKTIEAKCLEIMRDFTGSFIRTRSDNFRTFDTTFEDGRTRKCPLMDILLNEKVKNGSIDDDGIKEEIDTFMFEGHDTTAMCLNYTVMLLGLHPDIQEKTFQEIITILGHKEPTINDLQQMHLLDRVIKESLRLYPSVPLIGRRANADIPTKYGTIPRGADILIHIIDLHRNADYWPNPYVFDPDRHTIENSRNRHPYLYIPFSAGPRNCIGQKYAMLEIKALFCQLLREFIIKPVDTPESLVHIQDLVLRSRDGVKVQFLLRNM